MKHLESFVLFSPGHFDKVLCQDIIRTYKDSNEWAPAVTSAEMFNFDSPQIRKSHNVDLSDEGLVERIFPPLFELIAFYQQNHPWCAVSADEGFNLLRYEKGDFHKPHVDSPAPFTRILSLVVGVSSASEYEGGEFEMEDGPSFKLDQGDTLIFPANPLFPHQVKEVTGGTRYTMVSWLK